MADLDWILYRGRTFDFHTDLRAVLAPIREDVAAFKWLLSDLDYMADGSDMPINFDQDYFILDKDKFKSLLSHDIQFIWGSILGFLPETDILFDPAALPFGEGNDLIFKPGNIQIPGAVIEIDCWDSSITIVKFTDEKLSTKFHDYYPDFSPLSKFKG